MAATLGRSKSQLMEAGTRSDVFAVRDGLDRQLIAKLVYDVAERVEVGLRASQAVQVSTGLATGFPIRSTAGTLTVPTESVDGLQHPLAILTRVLGPTVSATSRPADAGRLLAEVHQALSGLELETGDRLRAGHPRARAQPLHRLVVARAVGHGWVVHRHLDLVDGLHPLREPIRHR